MDSKRKAVNKLPKELRRISGYNVSNKCRLDLGRNASQDSVLVSDQNSAPGHDRILHETSLVIVNSQPAQTYTQPSYLSELDLRPLQLEGSKGIKFQSPGYVFNRLPLDANKQ
ncbi:hypothetical protein GTR04_1386 [Trichophyton interdigitale]|uniref:Uncharacterized protein n=1 Tax=Trichophyton interdigitale TaxID=101480 RepID=A0A9P4YK09_9EURO|nr:hypothetical protein GY631_1081 [Trichophyton interdigitale]KAF3900440.1 hypothetical protein GY632_0799 [Trichophyton interdigitale]KAG8211238.1 hypothetical protein GTR04_1386 [Trichophyton interdigitale]